MSRCQARLLGLEGVVYDDGQALVIDGTSGDRRPFGCFACQERCAEQPGSCFCMELRPDASRACLAQPYTVRLVKSGAVWRGSIAILTYANRYEGSVEARRVVGHDTTKQTFVVEIAPPSSLPTK